MPDNLRFTCTAPPGYWRCLAHHLGAADAERLAALAVSALRRGIELSETIKLEMQIEPDLDPLRDYPLFQELLE
jgi:hypothetical protein